MGAADSTICREVRRLHVTTVEAMTAIADKVSDLAGRSNYNGQCLIHYFWISGKQIAQLKRKADNPLSYRLVRQYFINEQSSAFSHPPGATAGAD